MRTKMILGLLLFLLIGCSKSPYGKQELIQNSDQVTRITYPITNYDTLNNEIFNQVNTCRLSFELNSTERQFSYTQYTENNILSFLFTCYEYHETETIHFNAITYNTNTDTIIKIQDCQEWDHQNDLNGDENFYYNKDTILIPQNNQLLKINRINPISVDEDTTNSQTQNTIDPNKPMVALTFDDGPNSRYTPKILDILEENHVKATFFVIGQQISSHEDVIKRMTHNGNQIGIHTFTHRDLTKLTDKQIQDEINQTAQTLSQLNYTPTVVRPPYGSYNQHIIDLIEYPLILWNIDTRDWESLNTKSIVNLVKENIKDGDIILFHDMYPTTVEAIKTIVPYLLKEGYQLVTIDELQNYKANTKIKQKDS